MKMSDWRQSVEFVAAASISAEHALHLAARVIDGAELTDDERAVFATGKVARIRAALQRTAMELTSMREDLS